MCGDGCTRVQVSSRLDARSWAWLSHSMACTAETEGAHWFQERGSRRRETSGALGVRVLACALTVAGQPWYSAALKGGIRPSFLSLHLTPQANHLVPGSLGVADLFQFIAQP